MSHSPDDSSAGKAEVDAYGEPFKVLARMLRSGRSLSGRERNCCFLNMGGEQFADVSDVAGISFPDDARCVALTDWDFDGDVDIWLLNRTRPRIRFMRNNVGSRQHFIALRLEGSESHRDAIGARVELYLDDANSPTQIKSVSAGNGFATQSSKWLHFGLGDNNEVKKLVVRWPNGTQQELKGVNADAFYLLSEGDETARPFAAKLPQLVLKPSPPEPPKTAEDRVRIGMVGATPLPKLHYRTWDDKPQQLEFPRSRPLLINVWASWCQPCLVELKEMSESAEAIRAAGVDFLALTVDGVQDNKAAEIADAQSFLKRVGFPFESGRVSVDLLDKLQIAQLPFVEPTTLSGMPTSFLITADGKLAAIYKGPIHPAQLIADQKRLSDAQPDLADLGVSFSGRWFRRPETHDLLVTLAAHFLTQGFPKDSLIFSKAALAIDPKSEIALRNRKLATANVAAWAEQVRQFGQRVDANPDDANARLELAAAYRKQHENDRAIAELTEALRIDDSLVRAHLQLGFMLARAGDLDAAEKHFRRVLIIDPFNQAAKANLETIVETLKSRKRG